jgi:hypothetical protein
MSRWRASIAASRPRSRGTSASTSSWPAATRRTRVSTSRRGWSPGHARSGAGYLSGCGAALSLGPACLKEAAGARCSLSARLSGAAAPAARSRSRPSAGSCPACTSRRARCGCSAAVHLERVHGGPVGVAVQQQVDACVAQQLLDGLRTHVGDDLAGALEVGAAAGPGLGGQRAAGAGRQRQEAALDPGSRTSARSRW